MIYLFYGKDKYRLNARVQQLKKLAGVSNDGLNYLEIEGSYDMPQIISEATSMPFLASSRVLVIKGFLSSKNKTAIEEAVGWLERVPQEVELVFIEEDSPDQRLSISKLLKKIAKVEVFEALNTAQMLTEIERMVSAEGGSIDRPTASLLQMYLGTDLIRTENEISKLISFDKVITKTNIELLVDAGYFNTIFDLTDALATKNQKKALYNLNKVLDSGENETYLVSMLAMQVRNLMLVKDLKDHGLSESEVVSRSKLHPFVVKKSLAQVGNFTTKGLISMHRGLLAMDIDFKSSSLEPKALLTNYVLSVTI